MRDQKLHGNRIAFQVINPFVMLFRSHSSHFFQVLYHFPWITVAHKRDRDLSRLDFPDPVRIRLIKAGIPIHFIKIIYAQIIVRRLVLDNIVLPEYPSDRLAYQCILPLLDNEYIDLGRLLAQQVFLLQFQLFPFDLFRERDPERGSECRMPLQPLAVLFLSSTHLWISPFSIANSFSGCNTVADNFPTVQPSKIHSSEPLRRLDQWHHSFAFSFSICYKHKLELRSELRA